MKKYEYDYTIHPDNSPEKFDAVLGALKKAGYGDGRPINDVDGSTYQEYETKEGQIRVLDDYDIGAVYVLSDMDLTETLGSLVWRNHKKEGFVLGY